MCNINMYLWLQKLRFHIFLLILAIQARKIFNFYPWKVCCGVNAWSCGSILAKITLPINLYKIFLNDSNVHNCYFKKCYYFNFWIIHVQSPTNLPKSIWKVVFNVGDVFFKKFRSLKRKTHKVHMNNDMCKFF
jgi:hypothetical protein